MIWGKTRKEFNDRRENWHKWFAWRPIILDDGRWAWLQFVQRKILYSNWTIEIYYKI